MPAPEREDEIGLAKPRRQRVVHRDAEHAGVRARPVVDEVLAAERAGGGQFVRLAEGEHVLPGLPRPAAFADDHERPLGRREQLPQPREILVARRRARGPNGRRVRDVRLLGEHVFGQGEHHRPRPPREREGEGALHVLGHAIGAIHVPRSLRDATEHARVVELLPGLAALEGAGNVADEQDQRRRVLPGGVHADGRLRRARATRDEADPGAAGELAVRLRRVRGSLLVAAGDEPDRRVVERVEHGQEALARQAEGEVDAVQLELVDEDPAAAPHCGSGSSRRTVARWSFGLPSSAGSR